MLRIMDRPAATPGLAFESVFRGAATGIGPP
jgi:hypothetical protein